MFNIIKKITVCFFTLLLTATLAKAQQNSYTQYMENLTPVNPNFSFLQPGGSVNTIVRKQWSGVPGSPTTYMLNGDIPIESINGSAGLVVRNDVFAIEHQTEVNAFFAKSIHLNEDQNLAVSLSGGFRSYQANYASVDASDPVFKNNITETKPSLGFGVMFYTKDYYIGVSVPQVTLNSLGTASIQDASNFRNNYYLSGGFQTKISDDMQMKYAALVAYTRAVPLIADVSGIVSLKNTVGLGLNYRSNNEVATILSVNYGSFRFGYSYQFGTTSSNIGGLSNATHEFGIGFRFGKGEPGGF